MYCFASPNNSILSVARYIIDLDNRTQIQSRRRPASVYVLSLARGHKHDLANAGQEWRELQGAGIFMGESSLC